jgi:hypothetical protein
VRGLWRIERGSLLSIACFSVSHVTLHQYLGVVAVKKEKKEKVKPFALNCCHSRLKRREKENEEPPHRAHFIIAYAFFHGDAFARFCMASLPVRKWSDKSTS